jgi:periplasmic divalent cation tolerance protein
MGTLVLIYTTFANFEEAEKVSKGLLRDKLIVCVNMFPQVNSLYLWEDKIHSNNEAVAVMKSRDDLTDKIIERIEAQHSYSQPVILVIPVAKVNKSFGDWVNIGV